MASDIEEYSEEEFLDDEWPDEYFDDSINDVEKKEYRPEIPLYNVQPTFRDDENADRPKTPPNTSQAAFSVLTQDVLRKIVEPLELADRCRLMATCRQFKEAVENSRWTNLGNGKLTVTAVERPSARLSSGLIIHVSFGGIIVVRSFEEHWPGIFTKLHRSFATLHLKELQFNNVSLDNPLLQSVNDFTDCGISFNRLSFMRLKAGPISDREYGLINRAKREVVFNMFKSTLTEVQMLAFTRPVTLNIEKESYWIGNQEEGMSVSEELFVELVRRGHSLIKFVIEFTSVEALASVIETISSSTVPQKCLFRMPYDIGQSYVETIDAPRMFGPDERFGNYSSYLHLGAKIMLDHSPIPSVRHHFMMRRGAVPPAIRPGAVPNAGTYHPAVVAVISNPAGPAATLPAW